MGLAKIYFVLVLACQLAALGSGLKCFTCEPGNCNEGEGKVETCIDKREVCTIWLHATSLDHESTEVSGVHAKSCHTRVDSEEPCFIHGDHVICQCNLNRCNVNAIGDPSSEVTDSPDTSSITTTDADQAGVLIHGGRTTENWFSTEHSKSDVLVTKTRNRSNPRNSESSAGGNKRILAGLNTVFEFGGNLFGSYFTPTKAPIQTKSVIQDERNEEAWEKSPSNHGARSWTKSEIQPPANGRDDRLERSLSSMSQEYSYSREESTTDRPIRYSARKQVSESLGSSGQSSESEEPPDKPKHGRLKEMVATERTKDVRQDWKRKEERKGEKQPDKRPSIVKAINNDGDSGAHAESTSGETSASGSVEHDSPNGRDRNAGGRSRQRSMFWPQRPNQKQEEAPSELQSAATQFEQQTTSEVPGGDFGDVTSEISSLALDSEKFESSTNTSDGLGETISNTIQEQMERTTTTPNLLSGTDVHNFATSETPLLLSSASVTSGHTPGVISTNVSGIDIGNSSRNRSSSEVTGFEISTTSTTVLPAFTSTEPQYMDRTTRSRIMEKPESTYATKTLVQENPFEFVSLTNFENHDDSTDSSIPVIINTTSEDSSSLTATQNINLFAGERSTLYLNDVPPFVTDNVLLSSSTNQPSVTSISYIESVTWLPDTTSYFSPGPGTLSTVSSSTDPSGLATDSTVTLFQPDLDTGVGADLLPIKDTYHHGPLTESTVALFHPDMNAELEDYLSPSKDTDHPETATVTTVVPFHPVSNNEFEDSFSPSNDTDQPEPTTKSSVALFNHDSNTVIEDALSPIKDTDHASPTTESSVASFPSDSNNEIKDGGSPNKATDFPEPTKESTVASFHPDSKTEFEELFSPSKDIEHPGPATDSTVALLHPDLITVFEGSFSHSKDTDHTGPGAESTIASLQMNSNTGMENSFSPSEDTGHAGLTTETTVVSLNLELNSELEDSFSPTKDTHLPGAAKESTVASLQMESNTGIENSFSSSKHTDHPRSATESTIPSYHPDSDAGMEDTFSDNKDTDHPGPATGSTVASLDPDLNARPEDSHSSDKDTDHHGHAKESTVVSFLLDSNPELEDSFSPIQDSDHLRPATRVNPDPNTELEESFSPSKNTNHLSPQTNVSSLHPDSNTKLEVSFLPIKNTDHPEHPAGSTVASLQVDSATEMEYSLSPITNSEYSSSDADSSLPSTTMSSTTATEYSISPNTNSDYIQYSSDPTAEVKSMESGNILPGTSANVDTFSRTGLYETETFGSSLDQTSFKYVSREFLSQLSTTIPTTPVPEAAQPLETFNPELSTIPILDDMATSEYIVGMEIGLASTDLTYTTTYMDNTSSTHNIAYNVDSDAASTQNIYLLDPEKRNSAVPDEEFAVPNIHETSSVWTDKALRLIPIRGDDTHIHKTGNNLNAPVNRSVSKIPEATLAMFVESSSVTEENGDMLKTSSTRTDLPFAVTRTSQEVITKIAELITANSTRVPDVIKETSELESYPISSTVTVARETAGSTTVVNTDLVYSENVSEVAYEPKPVSSVNQQAEQNVESVSDTTTKEPFKDASVSTVIDITAFSLVSSYSGKNISSTTTCKPSPDISASTFNDTTIFPSASSYPAINISNAASTPHEIFMPESTTSINLISTVDSSSSISHTSATSVRKSSKPAGALRSVKLSKMNLRYKTLEKRKKDDDSSNEPAQEYLVDPAREKLQSLYLLPSDGTNTVSEAPDASDLLTSSFAPTAGETTRRRRNRYRRIRYPNATTRKYRRRFQPTSAYIYTSTSDIAVTPYYGDTSDTKASAEIREVSNPKAENQPSNITQVSVNEPTVSTPAGLPSETPATSTHTPQTTRRRRRRRKHKQNMGEGIIGNLEGFVVTDTKTDNFVDKVSNQHLLENEPADTINETKTRLYELKKRRHRRPKSRNKTVSVPDETQTSSPLLNYTTTDAINGSEVLAKSTIRPGETKRLRGGIVGKSSKTHSEQNNSHTATATGKSIVSISTYLITITPTYQVDKKTVDVGGTVGKIRPINLVGGEPQAQHLPKLLTTNQPQPKATSKSNKKRKDQPLKDISKFLLPKGQATPGTKVPKQKNNKTVTTKKSLMKKLG